MCFCVFLAGRGGPEMQEMYEFPLFSEGPGQEKHICVFLAFAIKVVSNVSFFHVIYEWENDSYMDGKMTHIWMAK